MTTRHAVHPARTLLAATSVLAAVGSLAACGEDHPGPAARTGEATSPAVVPVWAAPGVAGTDRRIPDDFPLAAGLPADHLAEPGAAYGLRRPNRTDPPLVLEACEREVHVPAGADALRAAWSNVEDFRSRQLVLLSGRTAAEEYVADVVDLYRDCPLQGTAGDGRRHVVVVTELGEESVAVSTHYTVDGVPQPGLGTLHVVRVGRVVLVTQASNEGGAGPRPDAEAAEQRAHFAAEIAFVVDAMRDL